MKKALKIGAVVLGMHYAFNLGYVIGLADPIVDAWWQGDMIWLITIVVGLRKRLMHSHRMEI